jgi:hypothetical protein
MGYFVLPVKVTIDKHWSLSSRSFVFRPVENERGGETALSIGLVVEMRVQKGEAAPTNG